MSLPKIGIIISTTREGRFGERAAKWLKQLTAGRTDVSFEIVDLRNYPLPFFDAPMSPRFKPVDSDAARKWSARIAELDGYVFVTAEYNRAISGVLKNALDHIYFEPARKPAAFFGYGAVGAARAIEQLRLLTVELGMAPTKSGVHINMEPFLGLLRDGKDFGDFPYLAESATVMLDELGWWTKTLKAGRDADLAQAEAA
jgi:NAD(P)H-dependent FMN reductase